MIIVDTREKKWKHIEDYFKLHNIDYCEKKLDIADYMLTDNPGIVIDRKQNLQECCQNLCSPDSSRFWKEIRRSKAVGIKMIILVEHGGCYKTIKDVVKWKSKYCNVSGRWVAEEMYRTHMAYSVEWLFCSKRSTGKRIVELLGGGALDKGGD